MALAAPISLNDAEGVYLLLEAGADPNRYAYDADPLSPVIYAAIRSGCSAELTGLLLGYGADPHIPGPDGRSSYVLAVTQGRTGLAMLLRQHGADVTVTGTDRLLAACQDAAMIHAAESGNTAAITLLLDLGFLVDARGDDGGTPLHAAAYSGSAPAVRLLLDRGAGVEARDTTWDSTPMEWAAIGSGEQPASHPHPDWTGTAQALLDAGASARDVTLSPDDPKPPSPEVAALLRRHGGQ